MTYDPLLFFDDLPEPAPFRGIAIADILNLPDDLQPLAAWLVRQSEVNWAQVVEYLEGDEVEAQAQLTFLVQRGFVQELRDDLNRRFRTRLDRRRSSEASDNIGQPFAPEHAPEVTCTLSGEQSVVVGESVDVRVTVNNPGSQSAVVNVYLDETSQPVVQWCPMPQDRLVLGPQQSGEVVFQVQVPPQALPNVYDYCLVVETPNNPEDLPRRYRQRLHVLPMQSIARLQDPTFAIQPATRADHPAVLQPGQILELVVLVQNASDHVDRFRLTCPDFSPEWVTVRYPQELDLADLIQETDGVSISPGATAQIMLLIHPPLEAMAGGYSSTVRLHSANQPDVMLLDVVHLQLQPIYALHLELRTIRGTMRQGAGQFSLRLLNDGNTDRELRMRTSSNEWFRYRLEPSSWVLPPKTAANAELTVQPRQGWRRPLLGAGRLIPFEIEIEDVQQRPLESDRLRGAFVWEPRPGWQVLLLALAAMGTVSALAAVLWLAFFKPIALPKIADFASESTTYDAATGETIRLRWQVGNPEQLEALRLSSLSPEGSVIGTPTLYDFRQGIPAELQPFCTLQQVLTCKGVETNVGAAGNYVFELAAISKQSADPAEIQKTPTIAILPPLPRITQFLINGKNAASKYLVPVSSQQPVKKVALSWQVEGGGDVKIELLPAPGVVSRKGAIAFQLTDRPTSETLTLKVTNPNGQQVSRSVTIETFNPNASRTVAVPRSSSPAVTVLPPAPPRQNLPVVSLSKPGTLRFPPPNAAPTNQAASPPSPISSPNPNAPAPTDPSTLSPSELPPQFD